jgi:hypothetical protein
MTAYPIPPSWQIAADGTASDWAFDDWGTWLGDGDAPYWVEATDKSGMAPGSLVSHFNQPCVAELVFLTDFGSINDAATLKALQLSILGGYDAGSDSMYTPFAHPQNANLFATSLEIRSAFLDNTNANVSGSMSAYRVGICKVGFQSLPYLVNASTGDSPYNLNWIEYRPNAVNQAFTSPVGNYNFTAGPQNGQSATLGTFYTGGLVYLEMVLHRIPATNLLDPFYYDDYQGLVNSAAFQEFAAGELLLQSADMGDGPFGDYAGNILVNAHLHFIYNPNKWNTSLANDGEWYAVGAVNGGAPPIGGADFNDLLAAIIPTQG